jgi:threonine dehydratase
MPLHTPARKVNGVRRWGAQAVLFGATYDDAEAEGRRIEAAEGLTFISPYNDARVIAGAGTVGLEIVEALPEVERVVVCVSGGGLIAGVATAVKALRPQAQVIGVNAESAPAMYNTFYGTGRPQVWDTLAEALSGEIEAGSITLDICRQHVNQIVLVNEAQIAAAVRWMIEGQGWLVEGGGAVGIAAWMSGVIARDDRPTALVVSGGNIDADTLARALALGTPNAQRRP